MELKITKVEGGGTLDEKIVLDVISDCDLADYILANTAYDENNGMRCKLRHKHWFKHLKVKAGDIVELYTKAGRDSRSTLKERKSTKHLLHWGLKSSLWNSNGEGSVLFKIC